MGEVYRARDRELDRDVAVKVLPEAVASDPDRLARFKREAKAVARLSHPSILEIYDFGREGDVAFAVTELLEGEDLGDHLRSVGGPIPWKEVRRIGAAVAGGLAAAQGNGVVHRDLKPSNIMICSDGRVKILDFGLARFHETATPEAETASATPALSTPGTVMGTVGYMSPEQVRGEAADARSDIFSLGCVLYEMLSGRRTFKRDTSAETMTAILREEPESFAEVGVEVAPEVAQIVERCLEKNPDQRFQSAADLAFALREMATSSGRPSAAPRPIRTDRRWLVPTAIALVTVTVLIVAAVGILPHLISSSTGEPLVRSIAVLPFDNLSGDPDQEYFADGMTEALITDLSRISALMVISRTSVMRFKNSNLSLPEIALELGVDAVVAGSVQREANQVRITAQLIDAATDRHLWADTFHRQIEGVLKLQSELARAIAETIAVQVSPGEETRLATTREVNPATYEAYLRGMHHLKKGTREGFAKGMEYLREAVDIDPADPLAHAGLATGYVILGHSSGDAEDFRRAKAAARQALEIDPSQAEAQAVLAEVAMYRDWDWDVAELAFRQAIELSPNHAGAHAHFSWLHVLRGDWEQAFAEAELAHELDPLAASFTFWLGGIYWAAGRLDDAEKVALDALELNPDGSGGHLVLSLTRLGQNRLDEAVEQVRIAARINPSWRPFLGYVLVEVGKLEEARALLEELVGAPEGQVNPVQLAWFQAAIGDVDGAMANLERGFEARHGSMPWIGSWASFDTLQNDPHFRDLLVRMDLEFVPTPDAAAVTTS
jgi:serine/threonine protein kinase/Tfp pilus assembly protein PilF